MPPDAQTVDTVVVIIAVGALLIGLISMGVGKAVEGYDRARAWWQEGIERAQGVNDFDNDITSSDDDQRFGTGSEPPQNQGGPADTTAGRTSTDEDQEPPRAALHSHLSRLELLTLLAVQKDGDGEYLYSANKIAELVGGARQKTLDQIGEARGIRKQDEPSARMNRPENGWR